MLQFLLTVPQPSAPILVLLRHTVTALVAITVTIAIGKQTSVFNPSPIHTIDPAQALISFVKHAGTDDSDADYASKVRAFHDKLLTVVNTYSQETGAIVLNSAAVLEGAEDITEHLVLLALSNPDRLAASDTTSGLGRSHD